jgi:Na+:H+ antiporter, NhaA family
MSNRRFRPTALLDAARAFIQIEASSGIVLLLAAIAALVWANASHTYDDLWQTTVLNETARHWVNDALMALFFFLVGLEIKRELVHGELSSPRRAALPIIAALGGMLAPAAIYLAFNAGGDGADGWGIPMATDIAFALGILSLLNSRVPFSLKVFLLALAIADDIGAIIVIAVFYTHGLDIAALGAAGGALLLIALMSRLGLRSIAFYVLPGAFVWYATYQSGIHATLAGVALGLLTPATPAGSEENAPLERLETLLHPYVSYAVVPLFALANAGVTISGDTVSDATSSPIALGVALGLLIGKPLGITLATFIAVRLRLCDLPTGATWPQLAAVGVLGGIGFTVSLLITGLAFTDAALVDDAKLAVLGASILAGLTGYVALRLTTPATGS